MAVNTEGSRDSQFQATELWNAVVSHLKANVKTKPKKAHKHCFNGTDAVEIVWQQLQIMKDHIPKEVTREKALRLCQAMLEQQVFEPVKSHILDNGKSAFQDCRHKFYRFVEDARDENKQPDDNINVPSPRLAKKCDRVTEREQAEGRCSLTQSPGDQSHTNSQVAGDILSPVVGEEDLVKEVALSQLLTLVDLPVLDDVIPPAGDRPSSRHILSTNWSSILNQASTDMWLESVCACLDNMPDASRVVDVAWCQCSEVTRKLSLYQSVSEYYTRHSVALWPSCHADIQLGLFGLLMQGEVRAAVKGVQLALLLLPATVRHHLSALLRFLSVAAACTNLPLSSSESNRALIERTFSTAIVRCKMLAPQQACQLFVLMLDNVEHIFQCPADVQLAVTARRQHFVRGLALELTYCRQVSTDEFQRQRLVSTEQALVALINSVVEDTRLSLKDKRQRLKQFSRAHPALFAKHFSHLL